MKKIDTRLWGAHAQQGLRKRIILEKNFIQIPFVVYRKIIDKMRNQPETLVSDNTRLICVT